MSNGMIYPTIKAMPSGTQRDSAYTEMTANSQRQAMANKLMSGGLKRRSSKRSRRSKRSSKRRSNSKSSKSSKRSNSRRTSKRRGGGGLTVPQFTMSYTPQGGPGTNPNNQIQSNSQTSTQITANKAFDNYASIKG
jgi:hypothetical protein